MAASGLNTGIGESWLKGRRGLFVQDHGVQLASGDAMSRRWPDFYIVGAPKAGTTSLYRYLKDIPGVFLSPTKEPHFFIPETAVQLGMTRVESEEKYLQLFRGALHGDLLGEASTAYLRAPEAPELIAAKSPRAKIIMILREPGARAFSHYLMRWASGGITESFSDGLNNYICANKVSDVFLQGMIEPGLYARQVKRYLETFGTNNVKIFLYDDFALDPELIVIESLAFLGIHALPSAYVYQNHNSYQAIRGKWAHTLLRQKALFRWLKPIVPPQLKWKLIQIFLQKKGEKPSLTPRERLLLTSIYQADVVELRHVLQNSALWLEHYPVD